MTPDLLAGRRILVVEDEMLVLMTIEDMLEDMGCASVSTAATVEQALALIETRRFDAATLDMNLSGVRSYPVADALASHGVPFTFASGYSDLGIDAAYRDRPMLRKPYRVEDMHAVMAGLLA